MTSDNLNRYLAAQEHRYKDALAEIKRGRKESHWMWFIFPQLAGLGLSSTSRLYAIKDLHEAKQYLEHQVLSKRLIEISSVLLYLSGKTAHDIFGNPDDLKLRSCMTLFSLVGNTSAVFNKVLDKYYDGVKDEKTIALAKIAKLRRPS